MRPGGEVITPMGILRTASNLYDQSTFHQRNEPSSRRTGREFESFGDLRSRKTGLGVLGQCRRIISSRASFAGALRATAESVTRKCVPISSNCGASSPRPASCCHALNATSPLFDQSEFLKYAANDPISKL